MFLINDIPNNKIMRKKILYPLNKQNKRKESALMILSPNFESTKGVLNHPLLINKYYNSYFLEKSSMYYISINENGYMDLSVNKEDRLERELPITTENTLLEEGSYLEVDTNSLMVMSEDASYSAKIKKLLYSNRIKTAKEIKEYYKKVQEELPFITKTFLDLDKYNTFNLIVDFSKYNEDFLNNNTFKGIKGCNLYTEFMRRLIIDKRFADAGYTNSSVIIIPICDWNIDENDTMWLPNKSVNPVSCIYKMVKTNLQMLKETYAGKVFLFLGKETYFKMDVDNFEEKDIAKFLANIKKISKADYKFDEFSDETSEKASPDAITIDIIDKVEKSQNLKIDNVEVTTTVTPTTDIKSNKDTSMAKNQKEAKDNLKKELVNIIGKSASYNVDTDSTLDNMEEEDSERLKKILSDLSADPDDGPDTTNARTSRMLKLEEDLLDKEFNGKTIKEILDKTSEENFNEKLKPLSLNVDSVNEEWKNLTYANTFDSYDIDADIVAIFDSFKYMNPSLVIREITSKDTSTTEDVKDTYTVKYESQYGERFTLVVDIPKFIDNRYLRLRGNRKDISGQLFLMPLIKTDMDTVQIVSNYEKIFIRRFGTTTGKSNVACDKLIKILNKNSYEGITVIPGDFSVICERYEVPIDYLDLSTVYNKIITDKVTIMFNQDEIKNLYKDKLDYSKGLPYGINNKTKEILYYTASKEVPMFAHKVFLDLASSKIDSEKFIKDFEKANPSVRYTYSKASILNTEIPLIVICAYHEGLIKVMKKAGIKYSLHDTRPRFDSTKQDIIKFQDGYLLYDVTYASSLLMNGLKACTTDTHSIADINNRTMYIDFLDSFGGRIKADGLDNFYNMLIDRPITYNTLKYYKLPTDYISLLLQANVLLSDNKFIKHTNITSSRRIRRNEQVAGFLYKALSESYAKYCIDAKHGRKSAMTIKQSIVIDKVLTNNTTEDQSVLNVLHEYESYNAVTPKGLSGMNSDRSYSLDKRAFDESMFNVLGLSTGFAGTVGITRQATIDMNVDGNRGYITTKEEDQNSLSPTKTYCMTEALTPFGVTRDDPFRSAMTFIQTSKHFVRPNIGFPALITSGADEALPYLVSNTFAHKAKDNGTIIEKTDSYVIVEYKDGTNDFIYLENKVEKNSSSGFYVNLKLDSDVKVGQKVKKGEILAYDKSSFTSNIGSTDNIAYNIGTLAKFAILYTDECFEDSAIVSQDLSRALTTNIVLKKEKFIPKEASIFNLVKKGQKIEEGDTLLTIQLPYDEEDANKLLRKLTDDEEEVTDLGRISLKSSVTGVVKDIVISRTVDKSELSPSLKKVINEYEKNINITKDVMKQYGVYNNYTLPSTETLQPTGKLKNAADGILIEIYLNYENKFSTGDKMIYYSALKGVCKDIFPEGKEPYTDFRPKEKIHSLQGASGVNGRMVTSILITGGINKGLIELGRKCKDILGIKYNDNLF